MANSRPRSACSAIEGTYYGPGGCRLTVRRQPDGGSTFLFAEPGSASFGWLFGADGRLIGLVAESRRKNEDASCPTT
jgi:hypothetical protein